MKYFFYLLLVCFLFSCSSNTIYNEPEDLIPKDTMQSLLTDMYLAYASKNVKDKNSKKRNNYLPFVYEKYKIDSTRFYTSNNYYTSKIEDYNEILAVVKRNIESKHTIYEKEFNLKDSIKKEKKRKRKRLKREKDSIKKAEKSKYFVPFMLRALKIDSTRFYDHNHYYNPKLKEYNHIIKSEFQLEEEKTVKKDLEDYEGEGKKTKKKIKS